MFFTLICMILQNYLSVLIILYFKPTFIGIAIIYIPIVKSVHDLINGNSLNKIYLIIQLLFLFSISIYLEIISLGCFDLDYNIKENILNRGDNIENESRQLTLSYSLLNDSR